VVSAATEWLSEIETPTAVIYVALAIILLLQLRLAGRVRRIINLIEPKRGKKDDAAADKSDRYMREETLAEFLERQKDGR
jgi:hypothetical protein